MTTLVTLHVFSGRPDPVVQLTDQQERELNERLASPRTLTLQLPSGVFGGLGYRGFSVTRGADQPSAAFRTMVHEGILEHGPALPNQIDDTGLETWLAGIVGVHLPQSVREHVTSTLAVARAPGLFQFPLTSALVRACPPCHAADAPTYNPAMWNTPAVQPHNNCYNYANDHITNTFAQPGRATGHQVGFPPTCQTAQAGASSDGLHSVPNFTTPLPKGGGWYVALVIWPGNDYHWYRQDIVGCWSHKPGQTPARNVDNSGHHISDPKTCDRGPYTDFCTYMVTNRHVNIN